MALSGAKCKAKHSRKGKQLEFLSAPPRHFGGRLLLGRRKGRRPLAFRQSMHLVMRSLWAKGENSFRHPRNLRSIENILKQTGERFGVQVYVKAIMSNHLHLVIRAHNRDLYSAFVRVISGLIASHVMRRLSFQEFLCTLAAEAQPRPQAQAEAQSRLLIHKGAKEQRQAQSIVPVHGATQSLIPAHGVRSSAGDVQPLTSEPQGKGQKFWVFRPFTRVLHWGRDFDTCCQYVRQNTLEAVGFLIYKPRKDRYATWVKESLVGSVLVT